MRKNLQERQQQMRQRSPRKPLRESSPVAVSADSIEALRIKIIASVLLLYNKHPVSAVAARIRRPVEAVERWMAKGCPLSEEIS